jgi:hypothetical protein
VAIVNVKVDEAAFGVIVAEGENEAVASFGGAVAISVTGLEYIPSEGATTRVKTADCPAVTVSEEVDAMIA